MVKGVTQEDGGLGKERGMWEEVIQVDGIEKRLDSSSDGLGRGKLNQF